MCILLTSLQSKHYLQAFLYYSTPAWGNSEICRLICGWIGKFGSFPGGTHGKEPACQCRRHKRHDLDPGVGKILWRRARQPMPVFLPGEFPWTEEPGGWWFTGSQRAGHDYSGLARMHREAQIWLRSLWHLPCWFAVVHSPAVLPFSARTGLVEGGWQMRDSIKLNLFFFFFFFFFL